jgi:hypothetical protein
MHAAGGLPSMRTAKARAVIVEAIRAQRGRFDFHVVQFARQVLSGGRPPL